jgi:hypothetical protein
VPSADLNGRTFDDNLALAAALVDIMLADVRALAEAIVDPQGPYDRLLVQVYGRKQQAMSAIPAFPPDYAQLEREAYFREAIYAGCQAGSITKNL